MANGHAWRNRAFLALVKVATGQPPDDVVKTLHYRPSFWGRPFSDLMHDVMRGSSAWTPGERELFAALTARLSDCEF